MDTHKSDIFAGVPPLGSLGGMNDDDLDPVSVSGTHGMHCEIELERMSREALLHHARALEKRCVQLEGEISFLEWEFGDFQKNLAYFSRAARLAHELTTSSQDSIIGLAITEVPQYFRCEYAGLYLYSFDSMRFELTHSSGGGDEPPEERDGILDKLFASRPEPYLVEINVDAGRIEFDDGEVFECEIPGEWVNRAKGKMLVLPLLVKQQDDQLEPLALGGLLLGNARARLEARDAEVAAFFCDMLSSSLYNAQLVAKLNDLIIIDPLTQIYNRRHLINQLDTAAAQARRQGHPLSVAMVDIDHFKSFNDKHGHSCGDEVLREVARIMKAGIRAGVDIAARYGGEEFMLVMPFTPLDKAVDVAERIRKSIKTHTVTFDERELAVTCSFGVAEYISGEGLEAFINRADAALYQAKNGGRDQVCAIRSESVGKC